MTWAWYLCCVCVCRYHSRYCVLPVLSFTKWSFGTYAPFFRDLFFKAPRLLLLLFRLFCSLLPLSSDSKRLWMTTTDGIKQISVPQSPMADLSPYSTCTCLPAVWLCVSLFVHVWVSYCFCVFPFSLSFQFLFIQEAVLLSLHFFFKERPVSHSHSCTFSWHPLVFWIASLWGLWSCRTKCVF